MGESADCDGADFRHKDIALLIHDQNIVIGKGPPDPEHDAVAGRNDILGLQAFMIGIGKVPSEEVGSIGFQSFYQRCGIGSLSPGGRRLQGHRLALGRAIGRRLVIDGIAGRSPRLRIEVVGIFHAGTRGRDARSPWNSAACRDAAPRDRCFRAAGVAVGNAAHQRLTPDGVIGGSQAARTAEKNAQQEDGTAMEQSFHQNPACSRMAATIRDTRPSSTAAASMNTRLKITGRGYRDSSGTIGFWKDST